jgi:hypothetical protein
VSKDPDQTILELGSAFLEKLRSEHAQAVDRTEQLAHTIEDVEQTLRILAEGAPEHPVQRQFFSSSFVRSPKRVNALFEVDYALGLPQGDSWKRRLRGFTQFEALIKIAEDHDGVIRVKDATDIVLKAGLSKGQPRNVYRHVLTLLSQSDDFERIGPGTYRLVADDASAEISGSAREESTTPSGEAT